MLSPVQAVADRIAFVDRVLANPPQVHGFAEANFAPGGVWRTDEDCYKFLAERCGPSSRTLETGLGVSTVLFAGWGCRHTCVVPFQKEADLLLAYCAREDVDVGLLALQVGWSDVTLPGLDDESLLDLVMVDGGHAFPLPTIDWYYAGQRLRRGGTLVVDDVQLPAVSRGLLPFLDADPRWKLLRATPKWRAYERDASGPLRESWDDQAFFATPDRRLAAHIPLRARRSAGRMKRYLQRLRG